jgi:hypothetical protein
MQRCDLTVSYRIYPRVTKQPPIFADEKLKLAELCLHSFRRALGNLRPRMLVVLDDCPPPFTQLFRDCFPAEDLELINVDAIGNRATFARQIELLLAPDVGELVYFAEDDYFYLPGALEKMVAFLRGGNGVDFVSPYDHRDYYTSALHDSASGIQFCGGQHWRTVGSTCLTFLTAKKTLQQTQTVFRTYTRRNLDVSLWMSLTKHRVFNPLAVLRYLTIDWRLAAYVAKAWTDCPGQTLFGKRRKLWVPIPSLATHMETRFLALGIDWPDAFQGGAKDTRADSN